MKERHCGNCGRADCGGLPAHKTAMMAEGFVGCARWVPEQQTESEQSAAYWTEQFKTKSVGEPERHAGVHSGSKAHRDHRRGRRTRKRGRRKDAQDERVITFAELANGERAYETIVRVTEEQLMRQAHAAEIALAGKRTPIIAVDFDGTLCENAWPGIGETKWNTVQALIAAQAAGARLILWTNRVGARLREAVEWCRLRELDFDAVNENLPEILAAFGTDCRKIYADIYLDDKAAQPSAAVLGALWETARGVMNEAARKEEQE